MWHTYIQGLLVGLSLIVAIGAQNAFVLKQGLRQEHVFWICLSCAMSDSILIVLGVIGFATVLHHYPEIVQLAKWGGALFLVWYGYMHAKQALRGQSAIALNSAGVQGLKQLIFISLSLTWLNPHVYLDTVILLGSISAQFEHVAYFATGAITASWLFFFALGYGARMLTPVFKNPKAWQILDGLIALVMWSIAWSLVF
ncbi:MULTISPECIES: LysE/ArgO family amino acid transporter [Acinetobacter]|jgi:L-lysine exporter family protein LysE/ArgO|uniref:Amino acid transporter n=1 Tax=Acinetobacter chengduensis TaxID=2420890 RepID=A0ABX9TSF4_9GAMM|nr:MULTISPECIES: LysE/ArgO family amino acid transporter [Acinetobacter]MBI1453187.1 amino acid transporter [Acinetobacter sp. FL51]RKG42375.1 amino acid transporter [Acinetobacter sp. WCHAc060007]RLL18545.1 amino acid transporter [Acinetobacter chengduensis]